MAKMKKVILTHRLQAMIADLIMNLAWYSALTVYITVHDEHMHKKWKHILTFECGVTCLVSGRDHKSQNV